jgi:3-hydroxybutyryl-CoA dehydrogenase
MGSGIAQLACLSGARTLLHDPIPEALDRGAAAVRENLAKGAQRGRWTADEADAAAQRLAAASIDELAPCELVIEAAPESLQLKHELFARLSEIVSGECVLATNTSSLSVTAVASAARAPERVVGMHFFNPAPLMRLLEVVAGEDSAERALELARATGEAMGKRVIDAADGPGFLVNRCNRPFGLEALRLLQEGIADAPTIDRIVRLGGGFRMGPFELMDLVGVDVGLEVSKSFYAQSFGEPRWRPSLIAQRMVDAGRYGRKSGRGYYDYRSGEHRPPDPDPPPVGEGEGLIVVAGGGTLADQLLAAAAEAGWEVATLAPGGSEVPRLVVDCGLVHDDDWLPEGPRAVLCDNHSLAADDIEGTAVGFHVLPPLADSRLVELTRGPNSSEAAVAAAERFFTTLGKHVEWVGDAPGLVLGRMVCQVINECAFALAEGVGSAEDIDVGMVLGMNYPRGPLAWADEMDVEHVLNVLQGLHGLYSEERYRTAPELMRMFDEGRLGRHAGAGFHAYDTR